jgi:hypothetical protein
MNQRVGAARSPVTVPSGAVSPPVYADGFGARWLARDAESGDAVEILDFVPELARTPEFASAVGSRVAQLSSVRHVNYARARRLERPAEGTLRLVSDRVAGWRLAEVLQVAERERLALDISVVLLLMRQLIPAVALFSRHQRDAAIGSVGPERLILSRQGRLLLADYVMAPGLERLQLSRERLWRELRIAVPRSANPTKVSPTADVVGMGVLALSLLVGRLLTDDEYLVTLGETLEGANEYTGGATRDLSAGFRTWIARALQLDDHAGFQSPQEAQVAFEQMLTTERGYVTTPRELDMFLARFEKFAGAPAELRSGQSAGQSEPAPRLMPDRVVVALNPDEGLALFPSEESEAPGAPAIDDTVTRAAARPPVLAGPSARSGDAEFDKPGRPATPLRAPVPSSAGSTLWLPRIVAVLAILSVLEAGVIGWLLIGGHPADASPAEVSIQSRPTASRVTIDGEERGMTPLSLTLPAGAHILEVRAGRSEPRVLPIDIRAGRQLDVYVELQSVATVGGLDVRSDPPGARVSIDGQFRGITPLLLRDLTPGEHVVLLEGDRQMTQTVRIEPGVTSELVVALGAS